MNKKTYDCRNCNNKFELNDIVVITENSPIAKELNYGNKDTYKNENWYPTCEKCYDKIVSKYD